MTQRLELIASFAALFAVSVAAQDSSRAALAERARDKIDAIATNDEAPRRRRARPVRTSLSEAEINAYLDVYGPDFLPSGITEPEVRLGDNGRVRARAIVDLNDVRRSRPRSWRDPLSYVTGSVEVVATGTVAAEEGLGRAQLENATVAGVSIPRSVIEELLQFYTQSPERPEGFDLDTPFELPASIRGAVVERERVTITQ
jgi:hypothetical protein